MENTLFSNINMDDIMAIMFDCPKDDITNNIKKYKHINKKEEQRRMVGHLLKHKLGYSKFTGYKVVDNYWIDYTFINDEGYPRYWRTSHSNIDRYLQYTNDDIMKSLFN